jgi:hypothetical protein
MASLSETQQLLWRLITAPEGVAAALAADADRGGSLRTAVADTVRSHGALDAVQRLDVYANMYFFRLLDVLKEDHPATCALLGEVAFHNLITDYLLRHPPTHFSIREAGRHLPELLVGHSSAIAHPCVSDLARFEGALNDAFDAADAPSLSADALAAVQPEDWPRLRFTLHPAVRLLACGWPVQLVRGAVDRGEPAVDPAPAATRLCVWRRELMVLHRCLDAVELAALQAVADGARFDAVCAAASESSAALDVPQRVARALAGWLADGWLLDRWAID